METALNPTFYLKAQKKYGGLYVARRKNKVLVSAKTLKDLLKLMEAKKISHEGDVSIGYVPSSQSSHVYLIR